MNLNKLFSTLLLASISISGSAEKKPNIVVVMADDIGIGDISYYHKQRTSQDPLVTTPNIDQLIENGMRFSDAHSPASLSAPTRFSMLTGNYIYRNKSPWGVWSPNNDAGIDPDFTTIARIAKQGEYSTAFFGKWGLGGLWENHYDDYSNYLTTDCKGGGAAYGFDYSLILPQGIQNKPYVFYEDGEFMKMDDNSELIHIPFEQTKYDEDNREKDRDGVGDSNWDPKLAGPILANKAVKYITDQAKSDKPFYLYYCSQAVHVPHTPIDKLDGEKIAGTTLGTHGDMIKELDVQVGMMIKALKKTDQYENTLFVFTSDNGGLNKDKALRDAGHDSSNGLTGQKGSIYEGGHRVPFVAVWPGRIEPSSESDVTIVGQDLVATLAFIVGVELDESKVFDSANLYPIFTGKSTQQVRQFSLYASQAAGGPFYALRDGSWKLVLKAQNRKDLDNLEVIGLYNFSNSTTENTTDNLMNNSEYAERIAKMKATYLKLRKTGDSTVF
jgi:arylsulfatase A-like enzyme